MGYSKVVRLAANRYQVERDAVSKMAPLLGTLHVPTF